jgi:hypothetical protein
MVVESGPRVGNADVERGKLHGANRTHQIHGISNYITTCFLNATKVCSNPIPPILNTPFYGLK